MKYIFSILILSITFCATMIGQNNIDIAFKKLKNNDNLVSMSFDEKIMNMVKSDGDKEWSSKIDKVEILMLNKDADLNDAEKAKIETALQSDKYETLVNVKSKEGKVKIMGIANDEKVQSIFASVKSDDYNIYFLMKGDIVMEEIGEMGLNFKGADALKELQKK